MRIFGRNLATTEVPVVENEYQHGDTLNIDKAVEAGHPPVVDSEHPVDSDSEKFTPNAQSGVKKIEATTQVWTRNHLIAAYIM